MRMPLRLTLIAGLFFAVCLAALLATAFTHGKNHDEGQFVAAGELLATKHLTPYLDYPYFHTPYLVGVYALIFSLTDHLFMAARAFSALCAWFSVIVIFLLAWALHGRASPKVRIWVPFGAAILFFSSPIFLYSTWRVWNHALPVLLMLLAFAAQCYGANQRKYQWFAVSGICIAVAAGTRISFIPLAAPFLIMAWFIPEASILERLRAVSAFALGMFLGLLPLMIIFAEAPRQFLFDNFVYNGRINSTYRGVIDSPGRVWRGKLGFLWSTLREPANAALIVAFFYFTVCRPISWNKIQYPRWMALMIAPFVLVAALLATPSQTQYYFPLTAICVVGIVCGFAEFAGEPSGFNRRKVILLCAVAIGFFSTIGEYCRPLYQGRIASWVILRNHAESLRLKSLLKTGRVLTLAPSIPLDGGLEIYPEFATGPFAWRTAKLLTEEERKEYEFVSEAELDDLLARLPPAGILVGCEKFEEPLVRYAQAHGYRAVKLSDRRVVWINPHPPGEMGVAIPDAERIVR